MGGAYAVGTEGYVNDEIWSVTTGPDGQLRVASIAHPLGPRAAATAISDGQRILVWGGRNEHWFTANIASGAVYDVASGTWADIPDAPYAMFESRGVVAGGVFVITGVGNPHIPVNMMTYDPTSASWNAFALAGYSPTKAPGAGGGWQVYDVAADSDGTIWAVVNNGDGVELRHLAINGRDIDRPIELQAPAAEWVSYPSVEVMDGRVVVMCEGTVIVDADRAEPMRIPAAIEPHWSQNGNWGVSGSIQRYSTAIDGRVVFTDVASTTEVVLSSTPRVRMWQTDECVNPQAIAPRGEGYIRFGGKRCMTEYPNVASYVSLAADIGHTDE